MKAFVFGEVVWDEFPSQSHIGGAPFNFAAHLSKLGNNSAFCSAVGRDENGAKTVVVAADFALNCNFIYENNHPTGRCKVTLDENKKPHFSLEMDSAYDHIEIDEQEHKKIETYSPDILYFGTLAIRAEQSKTALKKIISAASHAEKFVDINLRDGCYSKENIIFCLNSANILKISRDEEAELVKQKLLPNFMQETNENRYQKVGQYLCDSYPNITHLLVTLDSDGAVLYRKIDQKLLFAPAKEVKVISTVGAGDSFFAAFADAYKRGLPLENCLDRAIALSSFVVSKVEAVPNYNNEIFAK